MDACIWRSRLLGGGVWLVGGWFSAHRSSSTEQQGCLSALFFSGWWLAGQHT